MPPFRSRVRSALLPIVTLFSLSLPCGVVASGGGADLSTDPFYTRHLNPWVQVYGLPAAEGGRIVPRGRTDVRLVAEAANESRDHFRGDETLVIDGETYRGTLALRYGMSSRWEVGADVPVVGHAGGVFDEFIREWHDFFGLPEGNREDVEDDRLIYHYAREDVRTDLRDDTAGLGDVFLSGAFSLTGTDAPRQAAIRAGIKLPTGDSDRLLGSGSTDLSLRLTATDAATLAQWDVTLFGGAGIVRLGNGDVLDDLRRRWVGMGNFGFAWEALDWLTVKVQTDAHTSVFRDSSFEPIDSWALQIVGGFSFDLPGEWAVDTAVSENIIAETAPDVALHLGVRKRF